MVERDAVLDDLKANLLKAHHRMQIQEDSHRREVEYRVGDHVYLKLQPYCQQSLAKCPFQKLCARYYGPYVILQKIGKVAYKLDLPPSSKIHPVFHVSQLKKAIGRVESAPDLPPVLTESMVLESTPDQVLGIRSTTTGQPSDLEVLIKWEGMSAIEATWEHFDNITQLFPDFHLEDKVTFLAGGNAKEDARPPLKFTYKRKNHQNRAQGQNRNSSLSPGA